MKSFKILVLTDHTNHNAENSLYALARMMAQHPNCTQLDIATRGNELNNFFFKHHLEKKIFVTTIDETFEYTRLGKGFYKNLRRVALDEYDVVWLRMPPPLSEGFLTFLKTRFPSVLFINNPAGIFKTGSKSFLTNFADVCPPMRICTNIVDILEFKQNFPIVLKPFREYGGKGIVRIDGEQAWIGSNLVPLQTFLDSISMLPIEYLAVQFLKNVNLGDKRIIVVNGKILGASLRLPAKDSWICNVAMGGNSNFAQVDKNEVQIVKRIHPILEQMGIVMYGVDTLVGNDGKRVLSEINTTSIGGLPQIAQLTGLPLVEKTIDLIMDYVLKKTEKNALTNG